MDGKQESMPRPVLPPDAPSIPQVKSLKCPHCTNALTIRGMQQTESIACEACGSIIDLTDENLRILSTFQSKMKYAPLIPLGTRGKLKGDLFEVIGFLRRAITVEGIDYPWSEYLLFNPYKGFRWLSEYNGHWNFLKGTTQIPKMKKDGKQGTIRFLDLDFLHFQTAQAKVVFVMGEFYWKIQAGETCRMSDFISPPFILSCEKTDQETNWSVGEYMEPETIRSVFHLSAPFPPRLGVAPNQPSPYKTQTSAILKLLGFFFLGAILIHLAFLLLAENKLVFEKRFTFRQSDKERSLVTDFFELPGRTSNVVFRSTANVDNSWVYLHLTLIDEEGRAYDFGREIGYYHGVEEGERWSEGTPSDEAVIPSVPPGRYYLRIEPESSAPMVNYSIRIHRDVPQWSFLFIALGGLLLLPIVAIWRSKRFEAARWSESDTPP